jgi:hypothetical protein
VFAFHTALAGEVDIIVDFEAGIDTVCLDSRIFTGIDIDGALSVGAFHMGTAAADADDRIIWDPATGNLFYDADGNGAGQQAQFAVFGLGLSLTNADFDYQGSANYTVKIDGVLIGTEFTASAVHGSGQADELTIKGDWLVGLHAITVELTNDFWGGTPQTDRNFYVESVTYDGAPVSGVNGLYVNAGGPPPVFQHSGRYADSRRNACWADQCHVHGAIDHRWTGYQ